MRDFPIPVEITIQEAEGPVSLLLLPPMALVQMHRADPQSAQYHLWLLHDEREVRLMALACIILNTLKHGQNAALADTATWIVGIVELQST